MKKKVMIIAILAVYASVLATAKAPSDDQNRKQTESTNTYVLIVSGINKEPHERQAKDKTVIKLRRFFLKNAKVEPNRLRVLVDKSSSAREGAGASTAENLKKAMRAVAASIRPTDRFIFYYVGQANIVADKLRLNLPGKDITHEQLAEWIKEIKASSMLTVLDCPGAGLSVKALTGPRRIVICGAKREQPYSTRFSEYFLPSLADDAADTNGDGKVSLLEAFTLTSKKLDDLYRGQNLLKTETPVLEDNGDGVPSHQPWRYKQDKKDGLAASMFFLSAK